jgi:hypothetical protein
MLRAMRDESGSCGRVVQMGDRKYWAKRLRTHLKLAGVERAELFIDDTTRKHITFHDLKATAGTWMALRRDSPPAIMQRLAHRDMSTTMMYVRAAEMVGAALGEPFPELPKCLIGGGNRTHQTHAPTQVRGNIVEAPGIEFDSGDNHKSATSLVSRARSMRSKAVSPASRVHCSPRESSGIDPGLGDILETQERASTQANDVATHRRLKSWVRRPKIAIRCERTRGRSRCVGGAATGLWRGLESTARCG